MVARTAGVVVLATLAGGCQGLGLPADDDLGWGNLDGPKAPLDLSAPRDLGVRDNGLVDLTTPPLVDLANPQPADMTKPPMPDLVWTGPEEAVLTMQSFTIAPGQEVYRCQNFANPFGVDTEIREWESQMTPGSHHLLVFYRGNANGPLETCSGLEFDSTPYGAQTPVAKVTYPPGIATRLRATQGLRLAAHYLNASSQTITATVKVILRRAKPGTVTQYAAVFFYNNTNINIPPTGQPHTITKTCIAPQDMNILYATGHIHKHGTNLTAFVEGKQIYSTNDWSDAPFQAYPAPGFPVKAGQKITFNCTYVNKTGQTLTFGESASTNEMCIFDGQFYPAPNGTGIFCF